MQAGKKITIAEFEAFIDLPENQERRFELIEGEIVERIRDWKSGVIRAELTVHIGTFVDEFNLGRVVLPAYRHAADDLYNDLLPDFCFTRKERLLPVETDGAILQMPDLVIEIASRTDNAQNFRTKIDYYLAHGAQMIWLVHLPTHTVRHYSGDSSIIFGENDLLDGGDVLPGFTFAVKDIFDIE